MLAVSELESTYCRSDTTTAPSPFRSSPREARAVSREATASSGRGRDPT
jgi:hypothetical protein